MLHKNANRCQHDARGPCFIWTLYASPLFAIFCAQPTLPPKMSLQTKTSKNKFELASNLLALNAAPEYLPCRENEVFRISSTLRRYIQDEKGLTMYIAGETGTGKTACVEDVIRQLSKEKNLHFEYLYINAMKLRTASDAYHNLYEKMMHIKNGSSNKPKKKKQKIQKKNESKYLSQLFSSNPTVNPRPFMFVQ